LVRWLLVVLAASATAVWAHAVLTKSSVRDQPVQADTATTITLTFNSGIEAGFAQVILRGAGPDRPLGARAGAKPSEVVIDLPPLPPGAYALRYKVLAADGHVTESVYRFRIDPPR
jgi:methionine-rich copper-binding protein CopC